MPARPIRPRSRRAGPTPMPEDRRLAPLAEAVPSTSGPPPAGAMRRLDLRRLDGSSSPSHLATTALATALPTTLVAERPMSRKWSTARISSSPASGMSNKAKRRGDHHQAGARHAGDALRGDHQHQQHRDLLPERQVDAIGLGDEDRREGHVHHRAVEIERIAERQHEAGDPRRHAEPVERLQRARIGGLRRGGREGEQHRLADIADQQPGPRADDQEADADQQRPQQHQPDVEAAHEIGEVADDRRRRARRASPATAANTANGAKRMT